MYFEQISDQNRPNSNLTQDCSEMSKERTSTRRGPDFGIDACVRQDMQSIDQSIPISVGDGNVLLSSPISGCLKTAVNNPSLDQLADFSAVHPQILETENGQRQEERLYVTCQFNLSLISFASFDLICHF